MLNIIALMPKKKKHKLHTKKKKKKEDIEFTKRKPATHIHTKSRNTFSVKFMNLK